MELKTYLSILQRHIRLFAAVAMAVLVVILLAAQFISPEYSAITRLRLLTPISGSSSYYDFNIYYATRLMNTYASLATSTTVVEEVKTRLNLTGDLDITATVVADSELIKITVVDKNAELCAVIANTLAEILVDRSKDPVNLGKTSTEAIINERLDEVSSELETARQELKDLILPYADVSAKVISLSQTINENQQLYVTLKDRYEQYLISNPLAYSLTNLKKQVEDLKTTIETEQKDLLDLNYLSSQLTEKITIARKSVELKEQEYSSLVAQLDQARVSAAMSENTNALVIIDQAVPPEDPSSPNLFLIYAVGIIFSILAGAAAVFIVNAFDDRVYTVEQANDITHLTLLGRIPETGNIREMMFTDDRQLLQENLRRLRGSVLKVAQAQSLRTLAVSSADPGEGKSTIAVLLARELAKSGKHVILVDTDLRVPSLHRTFSCSNEIGLSLISLGRSDVKNAVQESPYPNLDLLTTGPSVDRPEEILNAKQIKSTLDQLKSTYDFTILDTPSILAVSDVDELISYVDGVILVVKQGSIREKDLKSGMRQLRSLDAHFIGYVMNNTEQNHHSHYYYPTARERNL